MPSSSFRPVDAISMHGGGNLYTAAPDFHLKTKENLENVGKTLVGNKTLCGQGSSSSSSSLSSLGSPISPALPAFPALPILSVLSFF